jgi:hypothetical protein
LERPEWGLFNLEQNQIIKIFSVAAVVFLPPTLVASIYGMNSPEFCRHLGLYFLLLLELDGRQHPVPDVFAFRVVEHFNVVEHVLASFIAQTVDSAAYPLSLQEIELVLQFHLLPNRDSYSSLRR